METLSNKCLTFTATLLPRQNKQVVLLQSNFVKLWGEGQKFKGQLLLWILLSLLWNAGNPIFTTVKLLIFCWLAQFKILVCCLDIFSSVFVVLCFVVFFSLQSFDIHLFLMVMFRRWVLNDVNTCFGNTSLLFGLPIFYNKYFQGGLSITCISSLFMPELSPCASN